MKRYLKSDPTELIGPFQPENAFVALDEANLLLLTGRMFRRPFDQEDRRLAHGRSLLPLLSPVVLALTSSFHTVVTGTDLNLQVGFLSFSISVFFSFCCVDTESNPRLHSC
jgi:hypothetical protein